MKKVSFFHCDPAKMNIFRDFNSLPVQNETNYNRARTGNPTHLRSSLMFTNPRALFDSSPFPIFYLFLLCDFVGKHAFFR